MQKIREKLSERSLSLFSSILIYFSFGTIVCFGSIFIYLASYFKQFDQTISLKSAGFISTISIPAGIAAVFSLKICKKIGFNCLVRGVLICFSLSVFVSIFVKNLKVFMTFYFTIPTVLCFGFIYLPLLNNIWNHYNEQKGRVTGYMFASLGISSIFFIIVTTGVVNPHNHKATIEIQEEKNKVYYFDKQVADRVPLMIGVELIFIILFSVFGIIFLKEYKTPQEKEDEPKKPSKTRECPNIRSGIFSQPFYFLFTISFLISTFGLFVGLNLRAYCLTKVNDDHFVTIVIFFNSISVSFGKIFWGYVFDKITFSRLFKMLCVINFFTTFPLAFVANDKFFLLIDISCISFIHGGLMCTLGPGVLDIFGKKVGPSIYPIKVLSFYLALLLTPLFGSLLLMFLTLDAIIIIFSLFNGISIGFAFLINYEYEWKINK